MSKRLTSNSMSLLGHRSSNHKSKRGTARSTWIRNPVAANARASAWVTVVVHVPNNSARRDKYIRPGLAGRGDQESH